MSMLKIGMVGDYDSISGFKAVGLETYVVKDGAEALKVLQKMVRDNFGIIFVVEDIAKEIEETIDQLNRETLCSIVIVPGVTGSKGFAIRKIGKNVEKAVGMDIFKT